MRKSFLVVMAASMLIGNTMPAMAEWAQGSGSDSTRWWYPMESGYYKGGWQWIDGKCYYFDENGWIVTSGKTPDGLSVNEKGEWVVSGVVQTEAAKTSSAAKGMKAAEVAKFNASVSASAETTTSASTGFAASTPAAAAAGAQSAAGNEVKTNGKRTGKHIIKGSKLKAAEDKSIAVSGTNGPTSGSTSSEDFDTIQASFNSYDAAESGTEEADE